MASATSAQPINFTSTHNGSSIVEKLNRYRKRDYDNQSLFRDSSTEKLVASGTSLSVNEIRNYNTGDDVYHQHYHGQTISRQLCNLWCGPYYRNKIVEDYGITNEVVVASSTASIRIPVSSVQGLFNAIDLYPTNLQKANSRAVHLITKAENAEVFLGGSCNPTTWRADIAIPTLKKLGISYYNPQVKYWSPDLVAAEHTAKESASVLLFMIDNQTRNVAGMIETAYLAASNHNVVLVMYPYVRNQSILDEILSFQEYVDLVEAKELLLSLARRKNISVFDNLKLALKFLDWLFNGTQNCDKFLVNEFNEFRKIFNYFDIERKGRLSITQFTFACRKLLNFSLSFTDLQNIIVNLPSCDQTISFDQFCSIISELYKTDVESQSIKNLDKHSRKPSSRIVQVLNEMNSLEPKFDILLGGTKNSLWRDQLVTPILKNHNVTFYDPCMSYESISDQFNTNQWQLFDHLLDKETYFKTTLVVEMLNNYFQRINQCKVALFVITADSKSIAEMLLTSYFVGLQFNMVLCVETLSREITNGEQIKHLTTIIVAEYIYWIWQKEQIFQYSNRSKKQHFTQSNCAKVDNVMSLMRMAEDINMKKDIYVTEHRDACMFRISFRNMFGRRRSFIKFVVGFVIGSLCRLYLNSAENGPKLNDCFFNESSHPINLLNIDNNTFNKSAKMLVLVGVLTAQKYLDTRAKAVYETWGRNVPGKILFFGAENSTSSSVPLIPLKNVDDSYPPQKKSFTMLKFMYVHYAGLFEWYFRADDDLYIHAEKLERFLRQLDSRKAYFIGQTGRGNKKEFGKLRLNDDENFCMGGPGILMSGETISRIGPHLDECMSNLLTTHEDVELGRCVRKFANVSCTWSYDIQTIFYHNQSGHLAFTENLQKREVHNAITMHPIKESSHMYRLHDYFRKLKSMDLEYEIILNYRQIVNNLRHLGLKDDQLLQANYTEDYPMFPEYYENKSVVDLKVIGAPLEINRYAPKCLDDINIWDFISTSSFSVNKLNPKQKLSSDVSDGLNDIIGDVMEYLNYFSKERGRVLNFDKLLYAYWRYDPLYGVDVILDLMLIYKKFVGKKMTVPVRRHAYLQRSFQRMQIREVPLDDEEPQSAENIVSIFNSKSTSKLKKVNFILPLSARFQTFRRFLKNYEAICLRNRKQNCKLIIVLYINDKHPSDFNQTLNLVEHLRLRYRDKEIVIYKMISRQFSRSAAIQQGVALCSSNDLLFFIDVDIIFNEKTLFRVRTNTRKQTQVYFPIVYSLYRNYKGGIDKGFFLENKSFDINEENGFWRLFGYGITSMFKVDFERVGGFNISIQGWGLEDVFLFEKFVKCRDIEIFRSADPDLIHVYHEIDCDKNLSTKQYEMCLGTKASSLGSLKYLENILLQKYN